MLPHSMFCRCSAMHKPNFGNDGDYDHVTGNRPLHQPARVCHAERVDRQAHSVNHRNHPSIPRSIFHTRTLTFHQILPCPLFSCSRSFGSVCTDQAQQASIWRLPSTACPPIQPVQVTINQPKEQVLYRKSGSSQVDMYQVSVRVSEAEAKLPECWI